MPPATPDPRPAARAATPLLLTLSEIGEGDVALVGGKALSLARSRAAGLPVPDGFCLTTEAMRVFIRESGMAPEFAEIGAEARAGKLSLSESWAFLGETRKRMSLKPLPAAIRGLLHDAYARHLQRCAVAVRSSGTREDLGQASFAGQYESYLNVRGDAFLEDAVRRCWASIWRNRVLQYSARKGGGVDDLAMGVLVQRLVRADAAGVLFTVNPLTGRDDEVLVESCTGLGEALVGGKVNPDRFVLDARTGAELTVEIAEKKLAVEPLNGDGNDEPDKSGQGVHEVEIPLGKRRERSIQAEALTRLVALGGRVAERAGEPVDIEWALERGELYLLQSRPITRISFPRDVGEWTNANFKDGGVASDVVTPFMASLYDWIFTETMTEHWRGLRLLAADREVDWLMVRFARPYWNVGEVKRALLSVPGFVERDLDTDLGMATPYEGAGRTSPFSLRLVLGALPTLLAVRRLYRDRLARARAFVAPYLAEYEAWSAIDPKALTDEALAARFETLLTDLYPRTEKTYFLTVYSLSMAKIDFKVVFDKVNRLAGGDLSYLALIMGLTDVSHLRPFIELYDEVARARATGAAPELAAYLRRWQHHGTRELDITVPRWGEDGAFIEAIAARALAGEAGDHPRAGVERQQRTYQAERARVARLFRTRLSMLVRPLLRRSFFRGLDRMRDYTWWREEVRDCSIRTYFLVRRFALEVGRRLAKAGKIEAPEDVFLLEHPRVLALAKGQKDEKARTDIAWAKSYRARFRSFSVPNEIGGQYAWGAAKPVKGGNPESAEALKGARTMRGVAGSPGRVTARAKVLRRLEEAKKVERGDVIVTMFTDPGWAPLLSIVGGIVTETGGLLSHAAVIAREYGIPAVLAASGATSEIQDGDRISVDGEAGTVEWTSE